MMSLSIHKYTPFIIFSFAMVACMFLGLSRPAMSADRHAGYYYPVPAQIETYKVRARALPGVDKLSRIGFVTAITQENKQRSYRPSTVFFAKGEDAQKMIIISLERGRLDTIYRVRAFLASLTAAARITPVFRDTQLEDILTFFDLARMLGFDQVTISDGDTFAHQVIFE